MTRPHLTLVATLAWAIGAATAGCTMADDGKPQNPNDPIVLMSTSMGDVKIELFKDKAPATVANFLAYVNDKSYDGTIRLGRATTTYDREGEPVGPDRDASGVTRARIEEAAAPFRGEFLQAPPPYSAKKVGGRKFYEMARKGESVPSLPKKVKVTELSFGEVEGGRVPFSISCSSGTYIRSIASDLGEKLTCGAHLETLRRSRIGVFAVGDAVTLEHFEAMTPAERLAPPHAVPLSRVPFPFPRIQLASLEAWKIRRGQAVPARGVEAKEGDWVTLLSPTNDMLALGQVNPIGDRGVALIKPRIVLAD